MLWYKKNQQTSKLQSTVEENVQVTGEQKLHCLSQWTEELRMKVQVTHAQTALCISNRGDNSTVLS